MFLKKLSIGLVIENVLLLKFILFIVKCVYLFLLKFWIIHVFENFIKLIEIFLLAMVDNLVTYIGNKNFKDFTIKDGER